MEKIRQIFALEPTELSQKWKVWVSNSMWHPCDLAGIIIYLLGFLLRYLSFNTKYLIQRFSFVHGGGLIYFIHICILYSLYPVLS